MLQLLIASAEERAARAGQNQPRDLAAVAAALQALENGGMFAVHRQDLRAVRLRRRHDQLAGTHQRFLVGQRNAFFLLDGLQRRAQTHAAHHGGDHRVGALQRGGLQQALLPCHHADGQVGKAQAQFTRRRCVRHHHKLRVKFTGLLLDQIHLPVGR